MSDYRTFTGSARLDDILQRKKENRLIEEDKTLLMIFQLSGLNLEEEVAKGNSGDREQRQYDLDDAAKTLTNMTEIIIFFFIFLSFDHIVFSLIFY